MAGIIFFTVQSALAQSAGQYYTTTSTEFIFSFGEIKSPGLDVSNIVRFSGFLNFQEQFHYDVNNHFGLYSGLGIRNVGLISRLNDSVKVKQRVYTLGLPVALKFGNMENGVYFAIGAEAELALNYKQKVFVNGEKRKADLWLSDRTNLFLPSVFAGIKFNNGSYLKFKYYLTDFLIAANQKINVPGVGYYPSKSQVMYISFGSTFKTKKFSRRSSSARRVNNI